ncbi:hypothetical protein RvY_18893 [Ramazzottius varieornatus]|uniref:Exocyst complex subunit Exo70 C-terminal domain-containing protein n=1 Tax=Ramazzottius varieornatus TaxID=947166 RepID=A0A1D1WBA3_RAMVA|nr:hypothetical protein RvY_18893 [Ramazzottius varieornatus]
MMEDNPDVDRLISGRIAEQRRAYVDCWTTLTKLLTEAIGEAAFLRPRSPNDVSLKLSVAQQTNFEEKLKEKDRQMIKDRCVAINKELTSQAVKQEKYSVLDHHLRAELKTQNRNDILHLYDTYRQR